MGRVTTTPEVDQSRGISEVTLAAAVAGSIIGVIITVIVCVCVGCITRRVHIQISCNKERRKSDASKQRQNVPNISVEQNGAHRQTAPSREGQTVTEIPEQAVQLNLAYGIRSEAQMERERTGEEYESLRMYAPNYQRSFGPIVPRKYALPNQQQVDVEDSEHAYEYIL